MLRGWAALFRSVLKENGINKFSFSIKGDCDNDFGNFTAFLIKCTQDSITKKEYSYDADPGDLEDDEEIWFDEETADKAQEVMREMDEQIVTEEEYDSTEYDVAYEAAEEYFEEIG